MRSRPDLNSYDFILVAFSGGKDSAAVLLDLLEAGVNPRRIELHHHLVDGDGPSFMDWPCTAAYCQAVANAFGIPLFMSYREGGFLREMHRRHAPTAAVVFEDADGGVRRAGGCSKKLGTRLRFPQRTADLSRRYCSSALKIDVMDAVIRNQERFLGCRTLVCTGERAEESPSRSAYAAFEPHRSDTRDGARRRRLVDHYRPVHGWAEQEVWAAMRRHRLVPHVAYQLGWSRVSCMTCVFLSAVGRLSERFSPNASTSSRSARRRSAARSTEPSRPRNWRTAARPTQRLSTRRSWSLKPAMPTGGCPFWRPTEAGVYRRAPSDAAAVRPDDARATTVIPARAS